MCALSNQALVQAPAAAPTIRPWPRLAVTAVFVAHGLLFASWTAHIPGVMRHLHLTDATLGIALLGAPIGSVTTTLLSSYLLPRIGSRRVIRIALVGYCTTGPLVGLTGSLIALFGALFIWGAFQGTLDVAMNTQAIAVERSSRHVLMSGLHGSWSIGSFVGAGIGALAVNSGLALTPQLLILGTLALLAGGLLTSRMLPDAIDRAHSYDRSERSTVSRWSGDMILLGAIVFAGMLCEGASADWASVYLAGPLQARGAVPGLAYAAFALAMVIVRLTGNRLLDRFAPSRLLPVLAGVSTIGFAGGLLIDRPIPAIVGFMFLGIGLASIVPAVFSAAGRIPGLHAGTAVATASACGWAGFVCGPPLIGRLASLTSLPLALGLLPVLTTFIVVATLLTPALRSAPPRSLPGPDQ
jgi:MFS family permease